MLKHETRAEAIQAAEDFRETEEIRMAVMINKDGSFSAVSFSSWLHDSGCHAFSLSWTSFQTDTNNESLDKDSRFWQRKNLGQ